MIFNIPLGGSSYITVTAPSSSSVSATCSGTTVSGTGSCTLEVPIIGEWVVTCVYDGVTKTQAVNVETFGESYSTTFTYSCTIVVNTQINSFVTISMSGQTSQTATASNGTVTFTVPKSGSWSVTTEYARGTNGATSKTGSVTAVYDASRSISIYPRIYIYKLDTGNGYYVSPYGLHLLDADNTGSELSLNNSYGAWRDLKHKSWDSGNNVVVTVSGIKLDGYTKMHIHARYLDAWAITWGCCKSGNNVYSLDQWTPKVTIKASGARSSSSFQDWEFTFSLSGYYHPLFRNLNGSSNLSADFEVHEWYIE